MTVPRPIAFILAATGHGTMIVNRHDYLMVDSDRGHGVGFQILNTSRYDAQEVSLALTMLKLRQSHFGDGVLAIDGGANIGVHTIEWARAMAGWGRVVAFEAQERVYYALAGNIAINNCFNASASHAALGAQPGTLRVPQPNYHVPSSFGSLELRRTEAGEFIGQTIDYSDDATSPVAMVSIDSLDLQRVDLIKIDVEGMEAEVLAGAARTLARARPIVLVETIKSDRDGIERTLAVAGYRLIRIGINVLAVHVDDPIAARIVIRDGNLHIG